MKVDDDKESMLIYAFAKYEKLVKYLPYCSNKCDNKYILTIFT